MINALYIASLVVTGLLVVALAAALLTVLVLLRRTTDTLGKVIFGVRAIAHRTAPVGAALTEINTDLAGVRDALRAAVPSDGPAGPDGQAGEVREDSRAVAKG